MSTQEATWNLDKVGELGEPKEFLVEKERTIAYAEATNDEHPKHLSGELAPPVFAFVTAFEMLIPSVVGVVPQELLMRVVHGEHDFTYHQPIVPGMTLVSRMAPVGIHGRSSGVAVVAKGVTETAAGEPVLTQYVTIFIRGMGDGESGGPDKPNHDFPDDARAKPAGTFTIHVDDDQTFRYREASGDEMPIHLDDAFAKSVGLPGIIAHGLCTMAMCSQAIIKTVADGDPGRLRRLAVRFASNVFPGNDIEVALFDAGTVDGRKAYAFEAASAGAVVIKNGWAEVEG